MTNLQTVQFSFIVTVCNTSKFVDDLAGSFKDLNFAFEVVVIDDCSEDGSGQLLVEKLREIGVLFQSFRFDKNVGLSAARNQGLMLARGSLIQFLDGDDFLLPELQNRTYESWSSNPVDVLFFEAEAFGDTPRERTRATSLGFYYRRNIRKYPKDKSGQQLFALMSENDDWLSSSCLFLFRKVVLWDSRPFVEGQIMEDNAFSLQLALSARSASVVSLAPYQRRVREGSISNHRDLDFARVQGLLIGALHIVKFVEGTSYCPRVRRAISKEITNIVRVANQKLDSALLTNGRQITPTYSPLLSKLSFFRSSLARGLKRLVSRERW